LINVSSNDYLGLSTHPALVEATSAMAEGGGRGASRLITGNVEAAWSWRRRWLVPRRWRPGCSTTVRGQYGVIPVLV
jgi:hypothetical protein